MALSYRGEREDRLVSFVDFAPTVLSLAGVQIPAHMSGKAFLGSRKTAPREFVFGARSRADDVYEVSRCVLDEKYIYIRNFMPHQPYVVPAIIFGDMKASYRELWRLKQEGTLNPETQQFWESKPYEELYDLEKDPFKLQNLAEDPAYLTIIKEMREILYGWIVDHRDLGLLPEAAANLCGHPIKTLNDILPLLDHPDPGVRYWAVLSIQTRGEEGRAASNSLRQALGDESPSVAIAAAELLCQYGFDDEALPVLGKYLDDAENPTVVLQAAISIRKLGAQALPLIPIIEQVYPSFRGDKRGRYKDRFYSMFIGFALDQTHLNCGLDLP